MSRVLLSGDGRLLEALERGLCPRVASLPVHRGDPGDAFPGDVVLTAHDVHDPARDEWVQGELRARGVPWLPVWADQTEVWAGPWVWETEGTCAVCAGTRGRASLHEREGVVLDPTRQPPAPRFLPVWLGLVLAAVVRADVARMDAGTDRLLRGHALSWSLITLSPTRHAFARLPCCPACGAAREDGPEPAARTFASVLAAPAPGGGEREEGPSRARLAASLLSSRLGLVRGVAHVDGPLPTVVAEMLADRPARRGPVLTGGRASTFEQAERVALFEALERHGGLAPGTRRPALRAAFADVRDRALDPRAAILHSPEQYGAPGFPYQPFEENREMTWVWGYSFRQRRSLAVPACLAYYGGWPGRRGSGAEPRLVYETSNGCALGGTLADALVRGLLEVMERDGFLLAWYTRSAGPALDLGSARDWRLVFLVRRLERQGYRVLAWDVTQDMGVPVVWVMAVSDDPSLPHSFSSCGCHPDPEVAAWGALAEVAAGLDDLSRRYRAERERALAMLADPRAVREMTDHSLLYAAPEAGERLRFLLDRGGETVSFRQWFGVDRPAPSRPERLGALLDVTMAAGLDVIAVDQTTPEQAALGLAAVRTLVPGALPMTFGHGYRRLEGAGRLLRRLGEAAPTEWPHPFP